MANGINYFSCLLDGSLLGISSLQQAAQIEFLQTQQKFAGPKAQGVLEPQQ